jgi:antitoxin component of MazEF toxin-antitoxin module
MKLKLFAAFFVIPCLLSGFSYGHYGHFAKSELLSKEIFAKLDTENPREIEYFFDLFSRVVYDAPMHLQDEICDQLIELYHHQQSWYQEKDFEKLDSQNRIIFERITNHLFSFNIKWTQDELVIDEPAKKIEMSFGIERPVLVFLTNGSDMPHKFQLTSAHAATAPMKAHTIEPGCSKAFLLTLKIAENASVPDVEITAVADNDNSLARQAALEVECLKPAIIKGRILDSEKNRPFPGRVYAEGGDGIYRYDKEFADNSTLTFKPVIEHLPIGKDYRLPFFYCRGEFELAVPAGMVSLTLERGFEHDIASRTILAEPGGEYELNLVSQRFIDMRDMGWYCGDTHIHWVKNWWSEDEDIELLAMVQRAEDIHVANNLTLFQYRPEQQGGSFTAPAQFPLGPVPGMCDKDYHIQMAEEFRNDNFYGHLNFLNIKELVQPISTGQGSGGPEGALDYPLNRDVILECRRQGGISIEAHNLGPFHRSDVPANVISGLSDSLDQLKPENYYKFLDCGIRVPITNGSDHPARVAGSARAYVKIEGEFTYEKWIDGIRKRRTFATSGPLLFFSVNGEEIGGEIDVEKGWKVQIQARVFSRFPVGRLEVVSNKGEIIKALDTLDKTAGMDFDFEMDQSRWFALRCSRNGNYSSLDNPDAAHSSAVYVNVEGRAVCVPQAVKFWIELLTAHKENVQENANFENDNQRQQHMDYIESAIEKYQEMLYENER